MEIIDMIITRLSTYISKHIPHAKLRKYIYKACQGLIDFDIISQAQMRNYLGNHVKVEMSVEKDSHKQM